MKPGIPLRVTTLALAASLASLASAALAREPRAPASPAEVPAPDPATQAAMAVVDRFGAALRAGDMATVERLLDERALILESGGAERSRSEYMAHHAGSDAAFLKAASVSTLRRQGEVIGESAWFGTESEIRTGEGATAKTLLSTETMVLRRRAGEWRIVHIHWSSRPKKA